MHIKLWDSAFIALALACGCTGTSSGNPLVEPGGPHPGPPEFCKVEKHELSDLNAPTELGVSAADVYALASGMHTTSLQWLDDTGYEFTPERQTTSLQLEVTRRTSKPRLIQRSVPADSVRPLDASDCRSRIEIDVRVRLRSMGGALDETLDATLRASNADEATLGYGQVDSSQLHGKLALVSSDSATQFYGWALEMAFAKSGATGTLEAVVNHDTATSSDATAFTLARWPAAD